MKQSVEKPAWILPKEGIRAGFKKILDARAENGWTPTSLGEACGMVSHNLLNKAMRGAWIFPNEQLRMSRVLHLINTGRLQPVEKMVNGRGYQMRIAVVPERCAPPPEVKPKTVLQCSVGKSGPRFVLAKERIYSDAELYGVERGRR